MWFWETYSDVVAIRLPRASTNPAFILVMATKKHRKKYSAGKEVRRRARELAGLPPAERVIPDRRRKPPKHKKELIEQEFF